MVSARTSTFARRAVLLFAGACLALAPGCPSPRTQVIVAVDADPSILALIDALRIDVTGPDGEVQTASASLADGQPLPRTLGLYWTQGPLGPYRVLVTGLSRGSAVTTREARFSFVRDRTVVLRITLVGRCLTTICTPPQVCAENGCRDVEISATELEPWTGSIERRDAGSGVIVDAGGDGGRPDAFVVARDAGIDAFAAPDAFVEPDAFVPPDAFVEPDAFVPMPDAFVPMPDAFVPMPDAFVPDAFVPMPDAFVPMPDAFVPMPDAAFSIDAFSAVDAPRPDAAGPDAAAPDAALPRDAP